MCMYAGGAKGAAAGDGGGAAPASRKHPCYFASGSTGGRAAPTRGSVPRQPLSRALPWARSLCLPCSAYTHLLCRSERVAVNSLCVELIRCAYRAQRCDNNLLVYNTNVLLVSFHANPTPRRRCPNDMRIVSGKCKNKWQGTNADLPPRIFLLPIGSSRKSKSSSVTHPVRTMLLLNSTYPRAISSLFLHPSHCSSSL